MFYNSVAQQHIILLNLLYRCTGIKSSNFKECGLIIFLITHFVKPVASKADICRTHFGTVAEAANFTLVICTLCRLTELSIFVKIYIWVMEIKRFLSKIEYFISFLVY